MWGNWTWESPNAVDAIRKLSTVTDIDDTQYYSVPNFREIHRSLFGMIGTATGSAMATGGANNVFGSNWTEVSNYINSNSMGAGGQLTLADTGWYELMYSGYVTISGGVLLELQCLTRSAGVTYSAVGGAQYVFAAGAAVTKCAYHFHGFFNNAVANTEMRPAYNVTVSAGTATLTAARWQIKPLYFNA